MLFFLFYADDIESNIYFDIPVGMLWLLWQLATYMQEYPPKWINEDFDVRSRYL